MIRTALLACLALAIALVAAGCGGDSSTTTVETTVTEQTNGEATENENPAVNPNHQAEIEEQAEAEQAEAEAEESTNGPVVHTSSFQSPSGNIGCVLLGGTARCDIAKRDWEPPARPPGCPNEVDFGQGLQVSREDQSGSFVCAGDTALNTGAPKLAYGSSDDYGGFLCASSTAGVICTNPDGHGFFLSIQAYRTF